MKKLVNFIKRDHPYVYLSGAVLGALGIKMASMQPSQLSFLGSSPMLYIPAGICGLFILLALGALAVKLSHWKNFSATAFKSPAMLRLSRYFSYVLWAAVLLLFIDRPLMSFAAMAADSFSAEKMPSDFVPSMLYLLHNGASFFRMGIWTTVRIALLGTLIAFVLALFMVTLRIQKPDRQDNDLVRFLKYIGSRFASIYITVIRGTPMMVQALIFYYAGFGIFKGTGMSVTEINLELFHLRPHHCLPQLHRLPGGGAERRHRVNRPRPDRGRPQPGHDRLADHAEGGLPPGGEKQHPRHRQRVHHQHQGLLGTVGHRLHGPDVCHHFRQRHLLQGPGDLLHRRRVLPYNDVSVIPAYESYLPEAGHQCERAAQLQLR